MTIENVGDKPRLWMEFRSRGKLTDPTAITFVMLEPGGTKTTYTYTLNPTILVKDSTGKYYVDWTIDEAGIHKFSFAGTGTVVEFEQFEFLSIAQSTA